MLEIIALLSKEVEGFHPKSEKELENFRIKYLGKKGELNALFKSFKISPAKDKRLLGKKINELKKNVQEKIGLILNQLRMDIQWIKQLAFNSITHKF